MLDPTPIYQDASKLSQEAYKAAKTQTDTIITGMSAKTAALFRDTVQKAAVRVNVVGEEAMAEAVQELASKGIFASTHTDKNGKLYRVPADVAVRQAVYTSGTQRFNGQVMGVAMRTGHDLIEVNSTPNCRPSHEAINGKVFSVSGLDYRYPRWTADLEALMHDYNCGHEVALYHEGLGSSFEDPLEGTGYTVEEARKAFSKQRRYENQIRKQKRTVEALKAGGMDTKDANARLNATRRRLQKHIDENSAILRRERHREQLYDSARRMKNAGKLVPPKAPKRLMRNGAISGALNDRNDPYMVKREEHARSYYEAVRKRDKEAESIAISANTGIAAATVSQAYEHLFAEKHKLDGGERRFDPSYDIAVSWQRLRDGKDIQPHDITLIMHEALEKKYMDDGMTYYEAHRKAEKIYNYAKEVNEFNSRTNDGVH